MATRIIAWLVNTFWGVIATSVIVVALILSLGRYYLPLIDNFRDDFEQNTGAALSAKVKIKQLIGDWEGFNPIVGVERLVVSSNVEAGEPPIRILSVNEAHVEIDLLRSVVALAPVYREALVVGLQLHFYKTGSGKWQSPLIQGGGNTNIADLYGAAHDLRAVGTQLVFHDNDKVNIVSVESLSLERGENLTQSMLRIVDDVNPRPLELVVETSGRVGSKDFSLAAYLHAESVDLGPYRFLSSDFLKSDQASLSLWAQWQTGEAFRIHGNALINTLSIGDTFAVNGVTADVGLSFAQGAWTLFSENTAFENQQQAIKLPRFRLDIAPRRAAVKLSLPHLNLDLTEALLPLLPSRFEPIGNALKQIEPKGVLRDVAVSMARNADRWSPSVSAQAEAVSLNSWRGAPAFQRLTGQLTHHDQYGWFVANNDNPTVIVPKLYSQPFELSAVNGRIGWHLAEQVTIASDGIQGESSFGQFDTSFTLDLPRRSAAQKLVPTLSMVIDAAAVPADIVAQIIPNVSAARAAKRWLSEAKLQGDIPRAKLLLNTSISKTTRWYPALQLITRSGEMAMSVGRDWPRLRAFDTRMAMSHKQLVSSSPSAQAMAVDVAGLGLKVDVSGNDTHVSFSGSGMGPLQSGLRFFQQTPLADAIGHGADGWTGEGDFSTKFNVGFGLSSLPKVSAEVDVSIIESSLSLAAADLQFQQVQGEVRYDNGRLSSQYLSAEVFGKPWQAELSTAEDNSAYYLNAQGALAMRSIADWLEQPLLLFARGESHASAKLTISDDQRPRLALRTDMVGVGIDLPEPFFKTEKTLFPVELELGLGNEIDVALRSDLMLFNGVVGEQVRGSIALGYGVAPLPLPAQGMLVTGRVEQIEASAAMALLDEYLALSDTYGNGDDTSVIDVKAFGIDRLLLSDEFIADVVVSAHNDVDQWLVDFNSPSTKASVQWSEDGPLKVTATQLQYPFEPLPKTEQKLEVSPWRPSDLIAVDFSVEQFEFDGEDYGSWQFAIRPTPVGVKFDNITGDFKNVLLAGASLEQPASLHWIDGNGAADRTEFYGRLSTKNVKKVFEAYALEPMLTSKRGSATIALHWPSEPFNFDQQQLSGQVGFKLKDGQFLRTEGAPTGLLKLLGVFNFDNLVRRMRLDFGDLVHEGLSYDSFEASLALSPGWVRIDQPLAVEGPSSDFRMTGELDLTAQTIDGELVAVVPVSKNLPWVAALAGGLPAAAGVFLASKVFSDGFDRLSSASYSIKGPWAEPEIKFERLFDERKEAAEPTAVEGSAPEDAEASAGQVEQGSE